VKPLACGRYHELLSARLDGLLTVEEERGLEDHLALCPACRAVGSRLAAIQTAFDDLEEVQAPEGFAQGVMDRIRAEGKPKVRPLFKRPQVRALAGLAACLALVIGLYGMSQPRKEDGMNMMLRSFSQDAVEEFSDVSSQEALPGDGAGPRVNAALAGPEDAPQIAAYAMPPADTSAGTAGMEKAAPNCYGADSLTGDRDYAEVVLTRDRMPEGGWELIPPETFSSPVGLTVSVELMEQLEQLALEQGIGVSRVAGPEANDHCLIVILDETE